MLFYSPMKKLLVLFICFALSGCVTLTNDKNLSKVIKIGMTKEQIFNIESSPTIWSRQEINGHIYETWTYIDLYKTYDFADNVLVGYSSGHGRYHTKSGIEDTRNFSTSQ